MIIAGKEVLELPDLKTIREAKGITQEQLAEKVGLTRQAIGAIENGVNKPSVPVAKSIAQILDFDWTLFYED